eukprot:2536665-Rhodomonas_salina.1
MPQGQSGVHRHHTEHHMRWTGRQWDARDPNQLSPRCMREGRRERARLTVVRKLYSYIHPARRGLTTLPAACVDCSSPRLRARVCYTHAPISVVLAFSACRNSFSACRNSADCIILQYPGRGFVLPRVRSLRQSVPRCPPTSIPKGQNLHGQETQALPKLIAGHHVAGAHLSHAYACTEEEEEDNVQRLYLGPPCPR